jgi:hypothetical protein
MTIQWLLAADPETVVIKGSDGNVKGSLVFAIALEAFGRDPHEYVKSKSTVQHAPLHRKNRKILAVKEFFENRELVKYYQNKISEFVFGEDDVVKVPYVEVLRTLADAAHENGGGGRLITHCIDRDMQALWFSDVYYSTNIFGANGPFYKSPKIKNWNSLKFLCSRKFFTSPRLNAKFLERYPEMIDSTLEGLVMTIRKDLSFVQSHRPQDDVDLLIEVLDHVYTSGISKQDFWDLLNMNHDFYDNKPVTVHSVVSPGSTRFCTIGVSDQNSLKN